MCKTLFVGKCNLFLGVDGKYADGKTIDGQTVCPVIVSSPPCLCNSNYLIWPSASSSQPLMLSASSLENFLRRTFFFIPLRQQRF